MGTALRRLLVVDDDVGTLATYRMALSLAGFDVVATDSGSHALQFLQANSFDLILTDLRMPDVSGLELLAAAREHAPHVPVVVLTCWGSEASEHAARYLGAADFISKPWDLEEFIERLRTLWGEACSSAGRQCECQGPATRRWVAIVVAVTCAAEDLPTVDAWADELHKSKSTLQRWCTACHVHAADSLDFARALRLVKRYAGRRADWYNHFAIIDPATMRAFLDRAAFSPIGTVPDLRTFIASQRFIVDATLLTAIKGALTY